MDTGTAEIDKLDRIKTGMLRYRAKLQAALDFFSWGVALTFGAAARREFDWSMVEPRGLLAAIAMAVVLQAGSGWLFGLYRGRWRFGSFEEIAALAHAITVSTAGLMIVVSLLPVHPVPLSSIAIGGFAALVFSGGTRYLWRLLLESQGRPSGRAKSRLLIFGAGEAATQVVTSIMADKNSPYIAVALLDDDRKKRNLRIKGVRVEGSRSHLEDVAKLHQADTLLIAIPTAPKELIDEVVTTARRARLKVRILPSVAELLGSGVTLADIRPLSEADLLGRHQIQVDLDSIAQYLSGHRILVTGAGGSIGSELCRQISRFSPGSLIMLDRDESALQAVQLSLDGEGRLDSKNLVLADIRQPECVERAFEKHKPEVIFHAAALKHVPILETYPDEAVRTNILGTINVLRAAARCGVERFVNISTDKAADPVNVLGYTKRISERLTAHYGKIATGTYLSVRFGNVLGSRGSVLETFRRQVEAGGPVTVTHPDVTRYFMTVEEAVNLVIQAAAIGECNEVLVLDMGDPVRISEVAGRMVAQADRPIEIVYTGLRPGEKLEEVTLAADEPDYRPIHPLVRHVDVLDLDPLDVVNELQPALSGSREDLFVHLKRLCSPAISEPESPKQKAPVAR